MTYIKTLTAPLIIIAGLALLTACAGGVAVTNNIGEININNGNTCTTEPFGDDCGDAYDAARVKRIEECLMGKAASSPTCNLAKAAHSCIDNPFATACASNTAFADYLTTARTQRTTYCETNPDETAFCAEFVKFNTACSGNTDIFNLQCSTDSAGRNMACMTHGINAGAGGHATCADILVTPCMSDPFTNTNCDDATNISGIRTNYCGDPATAWDDDCVVATYSGTADARDMACLQYGTDTTKGGHADCAGRDNVLAACPVTAPFAYTVCDEVVGIDAGFRTTFCQIPANSFTTGCEQTTHGDVDTARDMACLDGLPTATGCDARPNVTMTCTSMPLPTDNPGCANLPNYGMLLSTYCAVGNRVTTIPGCGTTATAVCPTDAFNPSAIILGGGTIDCLADADFAPNRRAACTIGLEKTRCDTPEIAPEVCKDSGAVANPFAAFCTDASNIGGGNIAQIRRTVLTACFDGTNDSDGDICQNTLVIRSTLTMDCVGAVAFETRCDYTEYAPKKTMFCEAEATTWNMLCDGETIGTTTTTRDAACLADKTADMGYTGSDTRCAMRSGVASACGIANPFAHVGCDNVVNIDSGVRAMYCTMQANTFKAGCKTDGTHDLPSGGITVADTRFVACSFSPAGTPANPLCATDSLTEEVCSIAPFTNTGCRNLMRFSELVIAYCTTRNPDADECKVNTSSWVRSFGEGKAPPATLTATTPATERKRQFLTGLATVTNGKGLDTMGAVSILANRALTLDSARYNGEPLGGAGDEKDGYGFFVDTVAPNNQVLYAGLLSDTDLGAPLTQASGSVTWYGQIQIFRGSSLDTTPAHDFTLEITFGAKVGVDGSVGSIEGFVENNDGVLTTQYRVAGTYDAGGVITGTTARVGFSDSDTGQLAAATPDGILTGLIGAQGAVGVFLSAEAGSTKDNIIDSGGGLPYVGGFVAAPYIPAEDDDASKVTFRDWLRKFNYPLHTSPAVITASSTAPSYFIRPKADGTDETLDLTGVTLATPYTVSRAGDDKDGFVYTAGTISGRVNSFAGILPSTDLGAPLTNPIETEWSGQFSLGSLETLHPIDFTLTFDGTNMGTINGMVGHVTFALFFDDKGIITGDVTSTGVGFRGTAPARGLIGEEGLVGVFANINGAASATGLFGGFVAAPPVTNYDAWLGDFSRTLSTAVSTAGATRRHRARQFLAGRDDETTLDDALAIRPLAHFGLTFNSAMYDGEALNGNSDARDGFAGFTDVVDVQLSNANNPTHVIYYAGLLTGTDLGAPLTDTSGSATLFGQIQIARFGAIDTNPAEDFSLEITLGGTGGVAGSIEGFVQSLNAAGKAYHLAGTYDTGGIITGTVTFGAFTGSLDDGNLATSTNPNGILSGLIGEHGAVGVFIAGGGTKEAITGSSSDQNAYVGGFVAAPPPPPSVATHANFKTYYADRTDNRRLLATPTTTGSQVAFVEGTATGLPTDGLTFDDNGQFAPVAIRLKKAATGDDGFALMFGEVAGAGLTRRFRAGLLSGTDLGPAVPTTSTATWAGSLHLALSTDGVISVDLPTVSVNFTNGTITAPETEVGVGTGSKVTINGRFGAGLPSGTPAGILGGTVNFDFGGTNQFLNQPLIGLIGTKGVIGVFHGPDNLAAAGGFQASPN